MIMKEPTGCMSDGTENEKTLRCKADDGQRFRTDHLKVQGTELQELPVKMPVSQNPVGKKSPAFSLRLPELYGAKSRRFMRGDL